jgi:hypothetical protein
MDWTNYTEPEMKGIFPKEPGRYKASVVFPAPLLQQGVYELWINLSDLKTVGGIGRRRGIFIEIADDCGSFASFPFKREGILALPLQWQVEQVDEI